MILKPVGLTLYHGIKRLIWSCARSPASAFSWHPRSALRPPRPRRLLVRARLHGRRAPLDGPRTPLTAAAPAPSTASARALDGSSARPFDGHRARPFVGHHARPVCCRPWPPAIPPALAPRLPPQRPNFAMKPSPPPRNWKTRPLLCSPPTPSAVSSFKRRRTFSSLPRRPGTRPRRRRCSRHEARAG